MAYKHVQLNSLEIVDCIFWHMFYQVLLGSLHSELFNDHASDHGAVKSVDNELTIKTHSLYRYISQISKRPKAVGI